MRVCQRTRPCLLLNGHLVGGGFCHTVDEPDELRIVATVQKGTSMKRALVIVSTVCALDAHPGSAQQVVPVIDLGPPIARSAESLGFVLGLRQVAGGRILVNDAGRRQMRIFDSSLATSTIVRDSTPGSADGYGQFRAPLLAYGSDSSLFPDVQSHSLAVLDGDGRAVRAWALPGDPEAMNALRSGHSAVDNKAGLLYVRGVSELNRRYTQRDTALLDTLQLVRADLDARRVDTVAYIQGPARPRLHVVTGADGRHRIRAANSLLQTIDEWAVLSDGTIGIVRGHDYHVDWIHPDGTKTSSGKMQFDWKRLTDDDKQRLIDSVRTVQDSQAAQFARSTRPGSNASMGGKEVTSEGSVKEAGPLAIDFELARPDEIADYYPPVRLNAAIPDRDGNMWILPTTSAQSKNGELVYDVVNPAKGLFERVRLPKGRSIAGFGSGGVVYLVSGDGITGFYLERSVVPNTR